MDTTKFSAALDHVPSNIRVLHDCGVSYFYRGARRTRSFDQRDVDTEVERMLDELPDMDDTTIGLVRARHDAIGRLLLRRLAEEDADHTTGAHAEGAGSAVLLPPGTLVRVVESGELAQVIESAMDRGVRVYAVETTEWGQVAGFLYKELMRIELKAI